MKGNIKDQKINRVKRRKRRIEAFEKLKTVTGNPGRAGSVCVSDQCGGFLTLHRPGSNKK